MVCLHVFPYHLLIWRVHGPYPEAPSFFRLYIIIPKKKKGHNQKGTTLEPLGKGVPLCLLLGPVYVPHELTAFPLCPS